MLCPAFVCSLAFCVGVLGGSYHLCTLSAMLCGGLGRRHVCTGGWLPLQSDTTVTKVLLSLRMRRC